MKPITLEWIDKAEGDWHSAQREYRARLRPNYDAACFHAQQCAEKYLKARLEEAVNSFQQDPQPDKSTDAGPGGRSDLDSPATASDSAEYLRCRLSLSWDLSNQKQCGERTQRLCGKYVAFVRQSLVLPV